MSAVKIKTDWKNSILGPSLFLSVFFFLFTNMNLTAFKSHPEKKEDISICSRIPAASLNPDIYTSKGNFVPNIIITLQENLM